MARSALDYRDEVIDEALPIRRDSSPDIVIGQPEISYHPPPVTGVHEGQSPSLVPIPPSPWNRPKLGPEGWYDDPSNTPVSDEPPSAKYPSKFLSPAERGFIKVSPDDMLPAAPQALPPQDVVIPSGPRLQPSALTPASYAGDVLSPYARGNAQLGQPSSVEGVKDEMARRFQTMVGEMPPEVKARVDIISGHRDAARQAQVNPSVKNSRHMHGMALDLGNDPVVLDWIGKNPQYGLGFPLRHMGPKEYNHLEMIDPKTGARASVGDEHLHEQTGSSTPPPQQQAAPAAAAGADQPKAPKKPLHPIEIFEDAVKEYPIIHKQGLTAGPGESTEYWPAGEPGTQARPRPAFIPIDQPGMEIGPDARPLDVLGDVVSHHMVNTDPVIKKHYEDFVVSLNPTQKELLQAQYMYYRKNEGETRPYDQWEKSSGLPAYFRGYAFQQWPQDFNQTAYTPQQRYGLDRMLGYLRTGRPQAPQSLQ